MTLQFSGTWEGKAVLKSQAESLVLMGVRVPMCYRLTTYVQKLSLKSVWWEGIEAVNYNLE